MSVNFYDNSGVMVGIDPHRYWTVGPPPTLSAPIPLYPYGVGAPFLWPPATWWKRTGSVKSEGWQMIQGGFDLYLVPHVPLPGAPPGPLQVPEQGKIIFFASSKARMSVHSVKAEGSALATCLAGPIGANVNCATPASMPVGDVLNLNSVKTTPTLGDYLGAAAGMLVDSALGAFTSGFLSGLGAHWASEVIFKLLFRRRKDLLKLLGLDDAADIADIPGLVQKKVQALVDAGTQ